MNNRKYYLIGAMVVLIGITLFWAGFNATPTAEAVTADPHAGHDHGDKPLSEPKLQDLEDLFSDDDHDDHGEDDDHGHASKPSAQAGHELCDEDAHQEQVRTAPHGEEDLDEHEGHGHATGGNEICPEHNVPEAQDALCQGGHIGELAPGQGMKVRLATLEVAAKAGIRLTQPQPVATADGIDIPAQVAFDRKQLAIITPLAAGVIRQVRVQPGAQVKRGDILAEIAMPEVSTIKAEFATAQARQIQTEAAYHREQDLLARGISSRQEFQQAESEYRSSQSTTEQYRQQLLNFGLSSSDINQLAQADGSNATVALHAPFDGVVTEVRTAIGEAVSAGTALFTVANLDSLWIELSIPESRIYLAQVDSKIQARFDGLPDKVFSGQLFQVGASIDQRTRALKALARVQNPGHRLKVGMFGSVRILDGESTTALAISADAVQSIDGNPYLFIQEQPDLFELRRVTTGASQGGMIVITQGLDSNDQVVSGQGFALKSEVLKARLGASCADH